MMNNSTMSDDEYSLRIADYSAIGVVLLISAGIGLFFRFSGGRQRTTKEFLMAGRTMSPFPVVFSLIVTFVSAVMMLGVPSEVYEFGLYRMLAYICSTISNVISAYIFLPVYFQMGDSVSVYEYLERRFGKLTRKIASVIFILHSIFFMSVVLFAPALALSMVSDMNIYASIVAIGGVCTIYCCMGGMKAVLWTDVFQAIVMYICVFAVFIKGIQLATTSIPQAFRLIHSSESNFLSFDPNVRYTLWNCVLYGFLYGLYNYGCNQAQIQRMLSVRSLKLSQRAVIVSVPLAIIFITMNFLLGIIMYANYHDKNLIPNKIRRDQIIPYFITRSFTEYPGLAGLCIAGIFSGSLSTVSSSVNSLAAVTMEDFVRPYFAGRRNITESTAAILVKVFACSYGIVGMICAFAMQENDITPAYTILYGITSGPILGLFTLGMMTISANEKGALCGLLSGLFASSALGVVPFIRNRLDAASRMSCKNNIPASGYNLLNNSTITNNTFREFSTYIANVSSTPTYLLNITNDFIPVTGTFSTTENYFNSTTRAFDTTTEVFTSTVYDDCSPTKKKEWLSIMWLLTIGFGISTVIGYIASLLKRMSETQGEEKNAVVDPALLSPLAKRWMFRSLAEKPAPSYSEELVKLNGSMEMESRSP